MASKRQLTGFARPDQQQARHTLPVVVYGDPSFRATLGELLAGAHERLGSLPRAPSQDQLRTSLIHLGQVEQAVCDGRDVLAQLHPLATLIGSALDALADEFVVRLFGGSAHAEPSRVESALGIFRNILDRSGPLHATPLLVKLPEGFAFYSVFPEDYADAAARWTRDHPAAAGVSAAVIGIRSIGTSLSAVVAAVLRHLHWPARRTTIRPRGHPFSRTAAVEPGALAGATHVLIVDEGPGLSGSSFVAATQAAERAGIAPKCIAWFPSHSGMPGSAASAEILELWRTTPRYAPDPGAVPFEGRPLVEALLERTRPLLSCDSLQVHDLGCGRWRAAVWPDPAQWPPTCAPLERSKFKISAADGRAVLWRFAGTAVESNGHTAAHNQVLRLKKLAVDGWTPDPLADTLGFIATPWIAERRPIPALADAATCVHLGRYITASAGPPLTADEHHESLHRIRTMLSVNTRESLGDSAAARADRLWAKSAHGIARSVVPSYGDGRLAPHQWAPRSGRSSTSETAHPPLLKLDAAGHSCDHTIIGAQPLAWDVAAAIVEWTLSPARAADLISAVAVENAALTPESVSFYVAAYSAFRLGLCSLARGTADPEEAQRLDRASAAYANQLRAAIA